MQSIGKLKKKSVDQTFFHFLEMLSRSVGQKKISFFFVVSQSIRGLCFYTQFPKLFNCFSCKIMQILKGERLL